MTFPIRNEMVAKSKNATPFPAEIHEIQFNAFIIVGLTG
jgi:hypothetical protein